MNGRSGMRGSPAGVIAGRLRRALEDFGITGDVVEGYGLALVSVRPDLVVWCECGPQGWHFRWWSGRVVAGSRRWEWERCPAGAGPTAARRIAGRYLEAHPGGGQFIKAGAPLVAGGGRHAGGEEQSGRAST
ncbi:hypothetical protein [Nonomuraea sp. NPDC048916]|uniref:hypothetical protein n=1 Tax=Nonomuraea sp. NPDC048916 TaxID=3154232 RepID=UPI0033EC3B3D